jgi:hypothetical protein
MLLLLCMEEKSHFHEREPMSPRMHMYFIYILYKNKNLMWENNSSSAFKKAKTVYAIRWFCVEVSSVRLLSFYFWLFDFSFYTILYCVHQNIYIFRRYFITLWWLLWLLYFIMEMLWNFRRGEPKSVARCRAEKCWTGLRPTREIGNSKKLEFPITFLFYHSGSTPRGCRLS